MRMSEEGMEHIRDQVAKAVGDHPFILIVSADPKKWSYATMIGYKTTFDRVRKIFKKLSGMDKPDGHLHPPGEGEQ